jgi:hypothetical protein
MWFAHAPRNSKGRALGSVFASRLLARKSCADPAVRRSSCAAPCVRVDSRADSGAVLDLARSLHP